MISTPPYHWSKILNGTRPWVVIQNEVGNKHSGTTILVPCSTSPRKHILPTQVCTSWRSMRPSIIHCEHIVTMDVSEDWKYMTTLPPHIMNQIDKAVMNALFWKEKV